MKKKSSAAKRMLKGINKGTAAKDMLRESKKYAEQMKKRLG